MWKGLENIRPTRWPAKQFTLALTMFGVAVLAFCVGRYNRGGKPYQGDPSASLQDPALHPTGSSDSDYDKRVVAYIHNNIPITREDLGEYLIARFGAQRVEF